MTASVLVTHPLIEGGLTLLEQQYHLQLAPPLGGTEDLVKLIRGQDALICLLTVTVTEEILAAADRLKIVANYAVGYDNIDLAAATRHGIYVSNTPGVLREATADLTWAALLALVRKILPGDAMMRAGTYAGWGPTLLLGMDLGGKTLGIIGLGQIGRAVARRAFGFAMSVIYTDHLLGGPVDLGAGTAHDVSLTTLLQQSDIISIHAPLTPETYHLLDENRLSLIKPTAYLVNTARGPLIDEAALVRCLQAGRLAGAALDVYEHEPQVTQGLCELENVVLLPHLGSATAETRRRMANIAAENVHAALQGRIPPNALNSW